MANSAFRLVDDDFDFEDLDEIDDIDLNGLANPEDGGCYRWCSRGEYG